jgi:hypothetical protein
VQLDIHIHHTIFLHAEMACSPADYAEEYKKVSLSYVSRGSLLCHGEETSSKEKSQVWFL